MTVLVVGGDRLGVIPQQLASQGFTEVIHWRGRQKGKSNLSRPLPKRVDRIIVLCDFVRHDLANRMKREAKAGSIPITFCRRSLSWLQNRRNIEGAEAASLSGDVTEPV